MVGRIYRARVQKLLAALSKCALSSDVLKRSNLSEIKVARSARWREMHRSPIIKISNEKQEVLNQDAQGSEVEFNIVPQAYWDDLFESAYLSLNNSSVECEFELEKETMRQDLKSRGLIYKYCDGGCQDMNAASTS